MKRILPWLLLLLLCLPSSSLAASHTITDNRIDVEVRTDGDAFLSNTVVYSFDGSYNGILVTLRHEDVVFHDLRVYVDGGTELGRVDTMEKSPFTYTATTTGDETVIQAYAPGADDVRTFRITYRIEGFALRYRDTARINYVFIDSESSLDACTVSIMLPKADDGEVLTFVHGALSALTPTYDAGVITLGPGAVKADTKLEMDILFPAHWLPDAAEIPQDMYEATLAQEASIAERAQRQARTVTIALLALSALYALGFAVWLASLVRKYGFRHSAVPTSDTALLDSLPAASAQVLLDSDVSASGLSATLLELVDDGALAVENTGDDVVFTPTHAGKASSPPGAALLDWLFPLGDPLAVGDLDAGESYEDAKAFNTQYNAWKQGVVKDAQENGWVFANGGARVAALLTALVAGAALALFLLRIGLWPLAIAVGLLAIVFTVAFARIRRLTDEGERRVAALSGFRLNYADMLRDDPQAILGRTPLVMALGYLEPLAGWVDTHPVDDTWDTVPVYWHFAGWHHSMLRMDKTVREAQSHNAGVQSSGGDSDSSGGGFSGGSGGGTSYGSW